MSSCLLKFLYLLRYLATKAPGHQNYRIILYYSRFNSDLSGWKLMSPRLINEKTTLFNNIYLFFGSLCLGGWITNFCLYDIKYLLCQYVILNFLNLLKYEYIILVFHKKISNKISSTFVFCRYYSATKSPRHKGEKLIIFPHQEAKIPMQKIVDSAYALPKKLGWGFLEKLYEAFLVFISTSTCRSSNKA